MTRRKEWSIVCALCAGFVAAATSGAWGAATIVDDERELDNTLGLTVGLSNYDFDQNLEVTVFGQAFNVSNSDSHVMSDADGSTFADQTSSLNGDTVFSTLTTSGSASISGQVSDVNGTANLYARSEFEIDFTIDEAHTFDFVGTLDSFGSRSRARARLFGNGEDYDFDSDDGFDGDFTAAGELAAGTYTLMIQARGNQFISGFGSANHNASFQNVQFSLTPVPEPASLAVLALGSLTVLRRRG